MKFYEDFEIFTTKALSLNKYFVHKLVLGVN